jgi:membrane-anchored protein YejM (alkaline phosphatase superfamily)
MKFPLNIKNRLLPPYLHLTLVLANTIISLVISIPLLSYIEGNIFLEIITYIAHFYLLNLAIAIPLYIVSIFSTPIASILNVMIYSIFQIILLIDIKIYSLFHFHINSLVWNVIAVEGVSDSVTLGKGTILFLILFVLLILSVETILNFLLRKKLPHSLENVSKIAFFIGLLLIFTDKALYAYGDLMNKTEITKNSRLYPLYQPLTIKRFASRFLGINVNREEGLRVNIKPKALNYPKAKIKFEERKNYNILIIAVEGLRFDMLDHEIMPEVWEFSKQAVVFKNHYSGGNGSRFGLFSLLYGISGTYWHSFLASRVSPVLIDSLIDKGYEFLILSSTRLTFPEFRKTAFVRIPDAITDSFDTDLSHERDRIITEKFIDFILKRKRTVPFFSFMFFDSSHQPYHYPEKFKKFKPVLEGKEINYFKDVSKDNQDLIKNKYKNAIYYEDRLIGEIIKYLKEKDYLRDTIVVVTGDHGEEFYENGYHGHTSSFDDYQSRVVFVLWHPDAEPALREDLTSHIDLVPTIMTSLGCTNPFGDYTQGISLLEKKERPFIITANWDTAAFIDNEYRVIFSTESYRGTFEVRTKDGYTLVSDTDRILKEKVSLLRTGLKELSEFYK